MVARVQAECPAFLGPRAQARLRAGLGGFRGTMGWGRSLRAGCLRQGAGRLEGGAPPGWSVAVRPWPGSRSTPPPGRTQS